MRHIAQASRIISSGYTTQMAPNTSAGGSSSSYIGDYHDIDIAPLHDYGGNVYNDNLYSFMSLSSYIEDNTRNLVFRASDLVQHTNSNGNVGYWIGLLFSVADFSSAVTTENAGIYVLNGKVAKKDVFNLINGRSPSVSSDTLDRTYLSDGTHTFYSYYWDVEQMRSYDNTSTIAVVDNADHTSVDVMYVSFSSVSLKVPEEYVQPMVWDKVSISQIKNDYLFGIDLSDASGNPLPDSLLAHYINSAVAYFETLLDINIADLKCSDERHDYLRDDYQNWGFIQLDHNPVKSVKAVTLMYGTEPSVNIPIDWVQTNKLTGQITLFPSSGSANSLIIGQTGLLFGFQSQWDWSPMMWSVDYEAGIDESDPSLPLELLKEAVSKRAACGILNVWGDLIIGAGIASQSVSIDGVSQSISTTQSAII